MARHTDSEYEAELSHVRDNLLRMTGLVEEMIGESVRAFIEIDSDRANRTIEQDHKVNRLEVDTDELCLLILAKRQPLASDLRFITLAMKMVTDIERIGDLAVNIAERGLALDARPDAAGSDKIVEMANITQAMIREAIDSFVARDVEQAEAVFARDENVDRLYQEICKDAQTTIYDNPEHIDRGMHLQAVGKFLERIGDHGTNLAELVIFMVKGKDIRHLGKLDDE